MKKFLGFILFILLINTVINPSISISQTLQGVSDPNNKVIGVKGTTEGYPLISQAFPIELITDYQVLFAAQVVAAAGTITGTYASGSSNLQKWCRILVTGSGANTWRVKFKGSPDGITYNYLADRTISSGAITVQDTLKIVSAVTAPGFWFNLSTTDAALIGMPFIQVEFAHAVGASSSATVTVEMLTRRF